MSIFASKLCECEGGAVKTARPQKFNLISRLARCAFDSPRLNICKERSATRRTFILHIHVHGEARGDVHVTTSHRSDQISRIFFSARLASIPLKKLNGIAARHALSRNIIMSRHQVCTYIHTYIKSKDRLERDSCHYLSSNA